LQGKRLEGEPISIGTMVRGLKFPAFHHRHASSAMPPPGE
jgi:hypothetical protein